MRRSSVRPRRGRVVPATADLCEALIARVPPEDDADMRRGWGMSSAEAIRKSFAALGPSYMILADGEPVGIFGCAPDGNLWMMRGEGIESVAVQFIRRAQPYFDAWLELYGHIYAFFWRENRKLLRFMEWSGFAATDLGNGYVRCDKRRRG